MFTLAVIVDPWLLRIQWKFVGASEHIRNEQGNIPKIFYLHEREPKPSSQ